MPPTSKKLRGHIGVIMSICLSVHYAFFRTRYLKNRLRYEADIWHTVSLPGLEKSSVLPVLDRFLSLKTDFFLNRKQKNRSIKVRFFPSISQ